MNKWLKQEQVFVIRKLSRRLRHKARLSLCLPRLNHTSKRGKRREKRSKKKGRKARRKEGKKKKGRRQRRRKAYLVEILGLIWKISFL